jgi:O-antigen/teichoic acid export membrane protein
VVKHKDENMSNLPSKISQNSFFNLLQILLRQLLAFGLSVIVARSLDPKEFGIYSLILWILTFSLFGVNLGFPSSMQKYTSEYLGRKDKNSLYALNRYILKKELLLGVAITFILSLGAPLFSALFHIPSIYFIIAALGVLPLALVHVLSMSLAGQQKFNHLALTGLIFTPMTLLLSLLVLKKGWGIIGLLGVKNTLALLTLIFLYWILRSKSQFGLRSEITTDLKNKFFSYTKDLTWIVLLDMIIWQRSEVFFLGIWASVESVGFYSLAFMLSTSLFGLLPSSFTSSLLPVISERYGGSSEESIRKIYYTATRYLLYLTFFLATLGVLFASPLINLFFGENYLPAVNIFRLILITSCFGTVAGVASTTLYATEHQRRMVKLVGFTAILNLLLDISLIPPWGLYGAVLANGISQSVVSLGTFFILKQALGFNFPFTDLAKAFLASLLVGVTLFLINRYFEPIPYLVIGALISGAVFFLCLIVVKTFSPEDIEVFRKVGEKFPLRLNRKYEKILSLVQRYGEAR